MQTAKASQPGLFNVIAHPKTYENIWYLFLSFPLGLVYFICLMVGGVLGVALMPVLVGFPILHALLVTGKNILNFERRIAGRLLGFNVDDIQSEPPQTHSLLKRFLHELSDANSWSGLFLMFFKFFLGVFSFPLTITLIAVSLAMLFSPLLYLVFGQLDLDFAWNGLLMWLVPGTISPLTEAFIYCALGVPFLFVSLFLLNGLSRFSAYFALALGRPH